jgi:hypothetical protein
MKHSYLIFACVPLLVACNQQAASPPVTAAVPAPAVAAPTGEAVTPGNMPAHCRGEASAFYGVKPLYIHTGALTKAPGGGYAIKGTADKGAEGMKPFQCNFDAAGHFGGVMSLVNEGKM